MLFKKELITTRDNDQYWKVKNMLTANNIECFTVTNTPTNPGRHHGMPFIDTSSAYQYHIFVKRKDFETAKKILNL